MAGLRKDTKSWPVVAGTAALVFVAVALFTLLGGRASGVPGENRWQDGVYTSEFLSLRFTLPDGWQSWDEKELGRASAGDAEGAERGRIQDTYLMWAGDPDEEAAVYIQAAQVSGAPTTREAGEELLMFYKQRQEMGVTAERLADQEIAGELYYAIGLKIQSSSPADGGTRQYLFVRMQDDYVVSISLAGNEPLELLPFLDYFEGWKPA